MAAALNTLAEIAKGRKVAVLGDMLELGEAALEAHRRIGRQVAEQGVEIILTVGELAKNIAVAAREHGVKTAQAFAGHQEAIKALHDLLKPGDYILIKGSRGMRMENILSVFQDESR